MPSRIIRDSCRTSKTLDLLSDGAERFFWRLTTVADDFGRFEAEPELLLSHCFPLRIKKIKLSQIDTYFKELVASQLVTTYAVNGKTFGFFNTWTKHQRGRAKESKFPNPTDDNICQQMTADVARSYGVRGKESKVRNDNENGAHAFGEFKHVQLTEEEHKKLGERLGITARDQIIVDLDLAVESKGYKYVSAYATILNWHRRRNGNKTPPPPERRMTAQELEYQKSLDETFAKYGMKRR